jgi:hypothetical protein
MIKLHNQLSFSKEIEKQSKEKELGLIETIVDYCAELGIEVDTVSKLLTPTLKVRVRDEAEKLHFLEKKGTRLDFLE